MIRISPDIGRGAVSGLNYIFSTLSIRYKYQIVNLHKPDHGFLTYIIARYSVTAVYGSMLGSRYG